MAGIGRVDVARAVERDVPPAIRRRLSRAIRRAARRLGFGPDALAGLAVRLVDDAQMRRLHAEHLGEAKATDVLSFPAPGGPDHGGDIAINWDAVRRQAADRPVLHEAIDLGVHALVHLLGHDHGTRTEARRMLRVERRGLRAVGLGAATRPYGGA